MFIRAIRHREAARKRWLSNRAGHVHVGIELAAQSLAFGPEDRPQLLGSTIQLQSRFQRRLAIRPDIVSAAIDHAHSGAGFQFEALPRTGGDQR